MAAIHTVVQGECLSGIARKYGITDWRTIYCHPDNAEFKRSRPNPNLLYPGDRIVIPDETTKWVSRATETRHRLRLTTRASILRVITEDSERNCLANRSYELDVDAVILTGSTDGDGLLQQPIPTDARAGRLTIGKMTWDLQISHLNPIEEDTPDRGVSGAQGRLLNM